MTPHLETIVAGGLATAVEHQEKLEELKALGVTTFLAKPYTAEKLLLAVQAKFRRELPAMSPGGSPEPRPGGTDGNPTVDRN